MVGVSTHVQIRLAVIFATVILDIYFWKTLQHVKVVRPELYIFRFFDIEN